MKPLQISQLKSIYDMLSLKGKTAFVTGGAGGIGRSCAAALAEAGADVVLMDICGKEEALDAFGGLFLDLQEKADNSEISTKCMDLRGLLSALGAVKIGLTPWQAVQMGIINKAFDIFEREIVSDMAMTRIPEDWTRENVF